MAIPILPVILLLLLPLYFTLIPTIQSSNPQPNFTATLFFGDSTLDTGNNDYISAAFRGNHRPYGQDFPGRLATGRFSNGLLVPDFLSSALGVKSLSPAFMDPGLSEQNIRTGVNFASAGAGYDEMTSNVPKSMSVSRQLKMFESYLGRLEGYVGAEEASRIVGNAMILISAGSNDFLLNFYDLPQRRSQYNMSEYQDFLLQRFEDAVKTIYNLGGRKFIIAGLPPLGCTPLQITASFKNPLNRKCVSEQNSDAIIYNSKLQKLLEKLQPMLPGSKLAYSDLYDIVLDILTDTSKYGFKETTRGCCGTGFLEIGPLCTILTPVCQNIDTFAFFDAIHPSERMYKLVAENIMKNVVPLLL